MLRLSGELMTKPLMTHPFRCQYTAQMQSYVASPAARNRTVAPFAAFA